MCRHFLRRDIDWRGLRLRKRTKDFLTYMSERPYNPKIEYIVLFGSEARGEAVLTSDVDIAVVSAAPLSRAERLSVDLADSDASFDDVNYRIIYTLLKDLDTSDKMNVNYYIKREGVVIYAR